MIANDLRGFLDGFVTPPTQFLDQQQQHPNHEFYTWERYSCLLMCYNSLSEEKMDEIVSLETAAEIWSYLKMAYDSKTTARIIGFKTQLQGLRKDNLSVSQYLAQIKGFC